MALYVILFLVCLSGIHAMYADSDMYKVNVKVYFDTLSIDSMDFFTNQLEPAYKELGPIMKIDPIAYGSVKMRGDEFICRHGNNECYGNEMMLCARENALTKQKLYDFSFCLMKSDNPPENARKCANEVQKSFYFVDKCLQNGQAEKLMRDAAEMKKQEEIPMKDISIIFDDEYNRDDDRRAHFELKKVVCEKYEEATANRPVICQM